MLTINTRPDEDGVLIQLEGRLDTNTAPELESSWKAIPEDVASLTVDYRKLDYVSSAGLPTAISYDIVTCKGRRGVLYEMLKADTLSAKILAEPEKLEENVRLFADLCNRIHITKGDTSIFPRIADDTVKHIHTCDGFTPEQKEKMSAHIRSIPDPGTYVHGDLHTNNIMMQNGEPCLIDMGDFSIGSPWFDIAQTYLIYVRLADTGKCRRAVGMEPELSRKVWSLFVKYYFGEDMDEEAVERQLKPFLLYRYIIAGEIRGWRKPREFFQNMYAEVEPLL